MFTCCMIKAFDSLTKTSRAERLKDLVPICDMVFCHSIIISLVVVVSIVEDLHLLKSFNLSLARNLVIWWC